MPFENVTADILPPNQQAEVAWIVYPAPARFLGDDLEDIICLVLKFLDSLSESERELALLRSTHGLSHLEVAQLLNVSERTIQRRWTRILQALGRYIQDAMEW
jgi:DNA-directed RNA polymerase specialized sigma subunit, sigma24 homolog